MASDSAGSSWPELPLGDLLDTHIDYRGKTPPKADQGVKLVTAKVIKGGAIDPTRLEYISEDTYKTWMRRGYPQRWDILITTEAPLGEVAQLITDERVALAQRVILLRANAQKIDPQYLFHFLRSPLAQERLRQRSSGTTVSGIRQPELLAVAIPTPDRSTQGAIGSLLDSMDELIRVNVRRKQVLEDLARSLYREWFVR
jgi:type I restriction enzyme S subunit